MSDECSSFGTHRFYMAGKPVTEFVPIDQMKITDQNNTQFYIRNEWVIMTCQCAAIKKVLVNA